MTDLLVVTDGLGNITWCNDINSDVLSSVNLREIMNMRNETIELKLNQRDIQFSKTPFVDGQYLLMARDVSKLQKQEKIRQDFIANVSHELRTPLTVFQGYLETLIDDEDNKQKQLIYQQMNAESERMNKLVADLLLLARLESDHINAEDIHRIDVNALVDDICCQARALSGHRQHRFVNQINTELPLYGAHDELRSAFSNLVFNAVHYSPDLADIMISWQQSDGSPVFSVQDFGMGIEPKHIPRLTERFYRVDKARSRSQGGTGLGLAITKHVLLRHNAQLQIQSQLGSGSVFSCQFPKLDS